MAPLYVRSNGRVVRPAPRPTELAAGISLCMIVKNEERFLEACLRSVAPFVDEICIVDTGSTDRTVEIARSFGARVEHRIWRDDFAWARNEALALATKRWIFVLDADEELDLASRELIRTFGDKRADVSGFWVRCNNLSDDYKGTGVSSHALIRLFPNHPRIRYVSPVHEFITLDEISTGLTATMTSLTITHHGYLTEIVKTRKKSERNLALVKTATEKHPSEPFNWYNLGTTSLLCGLVDESIAAFEKMRTIVGDQARSFVPNALAQLADMYIDRGEYDRAIEIANEAVRKAPSFANGHFTLGRALARQKRFDEARAAFEAAIADAEHAARQFIVDDEVSAWKSHSEIGSSYGNEGNNVAALEWFDRALVNRPGVVPLRMNRAKALERLERFDECAAVLKKLADDEPGDVHSIEYINFLLRRNDHAAVLKTIDEVLPVVTPRMQATLLTTAARLVIHNGTGDAETFLERAVAAHAGAADALEALENIYRARNDVTAVARLHQAELEAPVTMPTDHARRASRFLSIGRLSDAEAVTVAGLALAPNDADLRYNLGAIYVQTQRKEEAVAELTRAGTDGDTGLRAMFLRAVVLGDLGRHAEAIAAVDAVIQAAPAQVDARLIRFRFADALGWDAEAESTLRQALSLGDARVATELATWLLRKNRFRDAAAVAERALASA